MPFRKATLPFLEARNLDVRILSWLLARPAYETVIKVFVSIVHDQSCLKIERL